MKKPAADISVEVRRLRNELSIALSRRVTQKDLADMMGYTDRSISSYETGSSTPSKLFVEHLCKLVKSAKRKPHLEDAA
jgi:transcriptional regulator with XRE-family HTH domain